jgi:hypothetical protein
MTATPNNTSNSSSDILPVTCPKGHTSYFDKRKACTEHRSIYRSVHPSNLDELYLTCQTPGCGEQMIVEVDCGAYKKR